MAPARAAREKGDDGAGESLQDGDEAEPQEEDGDACVIECVVGK
jgi:hypothetical protein